MNINDFCIALVLKILDKLFIYGSDIENRTINEISEYCSLSNAGDIALLKAPHHGSKTTNRIFNLIPITTETICAITNFNNGYTHLPEMEMVEKYKSVSNQVYLFNDFTTECDYGILKSKFILENMTTFKNKIDCEGIVNKA